MNRGILAVAAVAALWAAPALAQPAEAPADVFLTTQAADQYLARDLILGAKVQNADGQIIGDVEDLILTGENQVVGVVMGTGGFAGFGEKRIAVALSALEITNKDGKVTVVLPQATKEVLDGLEPFKRTQPPKSLMDRAIEKARELGDKGSVTARDAYERTKEEAGPALKKAREAAESAYESAKDAVESKPDVPAGGETTAPATDTPAAETPATQTPASPPADQQP
jgi:PRC-barrel domain